MGDGKDRSKQFEFDQATQANAKCKEEEILYQ